MLMRLSNMFRVLFGHFTVIAMLVPTIFFTYVDTDNEQSLFFFISVLIASVASFGSLGLISGGILGFAATFPPIYVIILNIDHKLINMTNFIYFNITDIPMILFHLSVRNQLVLLCSLRIIFIPLIVACNIEPRYHSSTIIPYDGVFVLIILIFSISNGFCLTLTTMNVSKSVDSDLREIAGSMMNLMCVISSLGGSIIGVTLVEVIHPCVGFCCMHYSRLASCQEEADEASRLLPMTDSEIVVDGSDDVYLLPSVSSRSSSTFSMAKYVQIIFSLYIFSSLY
uniref:MFS domain-containing protein n=1 Tax=Heterorhabditis bacteriophora TaxID=37862 RepID=A0A1I7XRD4_HETBA